MNPLLCFDEFIPFSNFSNIELETAITYSLDKAQSMLTNIENRDSITWQELQPTFYLDLYQLNQIWGILGHLESVNDSPEIRQIQEKLQPQITNFYVNLGQNSKLLAHFKRLKEHEYTTLTSSDQKIIDNEFRDFFLSGITLNQAGQESFKKIQNKLAQLSIKFGQNVLDATDSYVKYVSRDELAGVPNDVLEMLKENAIAANKPDWYKLSLHLPSYLPVMQYCENRALRKELHIAYATRASEISNAKFDNAPLICQILQQRMATAELLGFKNYSELSLYTKMADNTLQVLDFLYQLADKSKTNAKNDLAELRLFAHQECGLDQLETWDIPFVSEKLQQQKYNYSNNELKQYFQLTNVTNGLFKLIDQLYQVQFKINTLIPVWHKDVVTYDVIQGEQVIGNLYLDLYARNGKHSGAWMNSVQNRFKFNSINKKQMALIVCNFSQPTGKNQSLLTFDDVQTLFHEMGHALHHLLTKIDHPSIAGINGVEWDAVELPSQFMEYFTWNYSILASISSHVVTGEPISHELYNKLLNSRHFQSGLQMLRQIELATVDITLHSEKITNIEEVRNTVEQIRQRIAVVFPPNYERYLNSFTHIFAGGYAAGYYSYKWAELLAMDVFSQFDEHGEDNYADLGQKFYNTILSQGGLNPMLENFIAFMGREPKIDALLKYSGITVA